MANCEKCVKKDVCKGYEAKSMTACGQYVDAEMISMAIEHFRYGATHDIFSEPVTTYARLAIEALEKRMPKKVVLLPLIFETEDGEKYSLVQCTTCKGLFANNKEMKSCPFCGQKLDWGDTK